MIVNTCNIDTIYGNRTINLIRGNVFERNSDIIVFSTKFENKILHGRVYDDLDKNYRKQLKNKEDYSTIINNVHVKFWSNKNSNIMMSIISDTKVEEEIDVFNKNNRALFSSIRALEFNGYNFRSISINAIDEIIHDNYNEYIKILLNLSIKYLKESKNTEIVNLYMLEDEDEQKWSDAFEKNLGRTYYKPGSLLVVESLINSLKETIETMYKEGKYKEIEYVLNSIYRELDEVKSLSINNIAINARKISEIISKEIAGRKGINIHKIKYDLSAIINLLAAKDILAPWVIQYLHMARVFGNKSAHVETAIKYQPNKMYYSDFISILAALYNILNFWYYNKEKI